MNTDAIWPRFCHFRVIPDSQNHSFGSDGIVYPFLYGWCGEKIRSPVKKGRKEQSKQRAKAKMTRSRNKLKYAEADQQLFSPKTWVRITRSSTKCMTWSWVIVPKVPWNTKKASTKNLKYFITTLAWRRMPWRPRCRKQLVWFNQRYSTDSSNTTPHTTVLVVV